MANLHFEAVSGAFAELPPEDRALAEDLYVAQTGVLPTAIKNALLGGLLSDDPSAQVAAAQRLVKLEDTDAALAANVPEEARMRGRAIAVFALPGLTPERVVELAEKRVEQGGADATGLGSKTPAPEVVDETRQKAAEEPGGELEVLEGPEAEPPGQAGAGEDQTVLVVRDPQTGETRNVTLDQLAGLESLADDHAATPENPPDELVNQIGEIVLSVLPVTGEAISARDAYLSSRAAQEALENDDLAEALLKGGETALNALGAIPVIGGAIRAPKAVAKAVPALIKLFQRTRRQGRRVVETTASTGRFVSRAWFGKWADNLLAGRVKPQGKSARVGALSPKVRKFVEGKGKKPGSDAITIIDARLVRMAREAKQAAGKALPDEMIRDMPGAFKKPAAVLWDQKKKNLLYVFDSPGDPKKGKFVVEVDFAQTLQRGDKLVRRQCNFVVSGGTATPRI